MLLLLKKIRSNTKSLILCGFQGMLLLLLLFFNTYRFF
uniref:Uncharacterized protein n=1 Tax=Caudovirales sp. ctaix4 TaxID=2827635 RepID=A0A8S5S585_9CAUD|nr:MAG TPA: hypothetical protein [Caudovirales sp. ctaix4]